MNEMNADPSQRSWIKYFTEYSSYFEGYTSGQGQLHSLLEAYELDTYSHFVQVRSRGNYGKKYDDLKEMPTKIRWSDPIVGTEPKIISDGIPFVTMGTRSMACQYGPSKTKLKDQQSSPNIQPLMDYSDCSQPPKKKKCRRQPSKKGDCPCVIKLRHILKFPDYKLSHKQEEHCTCSSACALDQNLIDKRLMADLRDRKVMRMEHWFYIHLPSPSDHANHPREWSAAQSVRFQMQKIDSLTYLCKDKNVLKKYEERLSNLHDEFSADIENSLVKNKTKNPSTNKKLRKDFIPGPQHAPIAMPVSESGVRVEIPRVEDINVQSCVPTDINLCYETNMDIHNSTMNIQNVHLNAHNIYADQSHIVHTDPSHAIIPLPTSSNQIIVDINPLKPITTLQSL